MRVRFIFFCYMIYFLLLYVDDILFAANDKGLLYEVKQFLSKHFDMKDMGEASYVIDIEIHRENLEEFWVCLKRPISIKF